MKIVGWAGYVDGPGHYRIDLPMRGLAGLGHDVTTVVGADFQAAADVDVIVGQRIVEPQRTAVWRALAGLQQRQFGLIFEIDDDLWNLDPANPHAGSYNNPQMRALLSANLALADAVTVSTESLAEVVRQQHPAVQVLPNCVPAALLEHRRPRRERLTVGWAGGESHRADFVSVQGELTSFFRRNPEVDVHFIGGDQRALVGRPEGRHTTGHNDLTEYHHLFDFDIALAPLAYHAFNRSKSDVKVLEYAALGIPVVASDFGPYAESVQHGVTGLLVRHPHEWVKHLRQLVNDEAMRAELGANARDWARTRTIEANAWRWSNLYSEVCHTHTELRASA